MTISGTRFGATQGGGTVQLAGNTIAVTSWSDTAIAVSIPSSSSGVPSGPFTVIANGLSVTSSGSFAVLPAIASFSPASGPVGTTVTIVGSGFSTTAANNIVTFNGVTVAASTATGTSLTVAVPSAAPVGAGPIAVTVSGKTATSAGNFTVTPGITGFSPTSGSPSTTVNITGSNFSTTLANNVVKFNGTAATVTNATTTQLTATVPLTASTGPISVTVGGQTVVSAGSFTVPPPTITGFTPASAPTNATITILGTNFSTTAAYNTVYFTEAASGNADIAADVTAATATSLTVNVPFMAVSGKVKVVTPAGQFTSTTSFTVTVPIPTISSFTPTIGPGGTSVVISGSNFDSTTPSNNVITFNGTSATTFTVNSSSSLTATVPDSATTGHIGITVSSSYLYIGSQSVTSTGTYTVGYPPPTISGFNPTRGPPNTLVTITGTHFGTNNFGLGYVMLGDLIVTSQNWTDTSIVLVVPQGAIDGLISVTTANGLTATSSSPFTVLPPPPAILSFSPSTSGVGTPITINGSGFSTTPSANAVTFNGVNATVNTATANALNVKVPSVAQGQATVAVTVLGQTATSTGFTVGPPPQPLNASVASISVPATVAPGGHVTATIQMMNTGSTSWTTAQSFGLGMVGNPQWSPSLVSLSGGPITINQTGAFTFQLTAPSTPGTYNLQWQMVENTPGSPQWFGALGKTAAKYLIYKDWNRHPLPGR